MGLGKIGLAPAQGIFGLLAILNVGIGPIPFDDASALIEERCRAVQEPSIRAVSPADARFVLIRCPGGDILAPRFNDPGQVFGVVGGLPTGALGLGQREAGVV